MLSIMGGQWRGRKLQAPERENLRPTAGRVKSAIFSALESQRMKQNLATDFSGARCLDLFAGVGGLGLEALSRGAGFCVFVERDKENLCALKKNISTLVCEEMTDVICAPVENSVKFWKPHAPFDYVFLDPPYDLLQAELLLQFIHDAGALAPSAIVVFEHKPALTPKVPVGWTLQSERKLGPAGLSIFFSAK